MILSKIVIKNYKLFRDFECEFNEGISILVGNNEVGKSTILEAINLGLTGKLNGRNLHYELTPYLCNDSAVKEYIDELSRGNNPIPPQILIELYFQKDDELASLQGTNNSKKENVPGVFISIEFNEEYADEYEEYIRNPEEIRTIPIEYYDVKWYSFGHNPITFRSIPLNTTLIDTTVTKTFYGTDKYISKIINDALDVKERADLALSFRKLKETFASEEAIGNINSKLLSKKGKISDKDLSVSVDISPRTNWESSLTSYLDDVPFQFIGKGEQNSIKMNLALETKAKESHLVLVEEPENHLSFSNMNKLIKKISEKCKEKQLILTTHSTFILNKLGLHNVILLENNCNKMTLKDLSKDTQNYFMKLPGYDTLRMLLSRKPILVEGPSDELIVQKAYLQHKGKLPIEDGVDIITVRGLSFKRFLEIAKILEKEVKVVTDNDGSVEALERKYEDYMDTEFIKIFFDRDEEYPTLEPQFLKFNNLDNLNTVLDRSESTKEDLLDYMKKNKTECALKIFESELDINMPEYIKNAIK